MTMLESMKGWSHEDWLNLFKDEAVQKALAEMEASGPIDLLKGEGADDGDI